eukprot:2509241-Ditylum_brightwellii.AAC.1
MGSTGTITKYTNNDKEVQSLWITHLQLTEDKLSTWKLAVITEITQDIQQEALEYLLDINWIE